ncbi:TAXI family TRAP transporter solute-binding subunit [Engelhardtia mirabilis]|uniref:TAXI family TRAP transporter solute-binding subunit n=1 Tax=Engelhardtia mirabilis TaxID=2528011 RepID=UPI003AF3B353
MDTFKQIGTGVADLGVVQSNTGLASRQVRAISHVFPEYLICLSRSDHPIDLVGWGCGGPACPNDPATTLGRGRPVRVGCFGPGSQTYEDVQIILDLYGLVRARDYVIVALDYASAIDALLIDRIDLAMFIVSKENSVLRRVLGDPAIGISANVIGHLDALLGRLSGYSPAEIAPGHFGPHSKSISTISTNATLVCAASLEDRIVAALTTDLVENSNELADWYSGSKISEPSADTKIPTHPGAQRVYGRNDPGFIERHLGPLQLLAAAVSALLAVVSLVVGHRSPAADPAAGTAQNGHRTLIPAPRREERRGPASRAGTSDGNEGEGDAGREVHDVGARPPGP